MRQLSATDHQTLREKILSWATELGFDAIGVSDIDLSHDHQILTRWLHKKYHANMQYMENNLHLRHHPNELVPNTFRIISARMPYLSISQNQSKEILKQPERAYISRYALGRDYHKMMRKRLANLAEKIRTQIPDLTYRVFADSAPVLEKPLARKAGLGWVGKHSLILDKEAGSWFFIGEIFTNLSLPCDQPQADACGPCRACREICPTQAIVADKVVDSNRCISYLTIENKGPIPVEYRTAMGNRIFGCDDCQLYCPWNRFAQFTKQEDFSARHGLEDAQLVELFGWSESTFLRKTEGSALRRTGYLGWLRNLAVALGNAPYGQNIIEALNGRLKDDSPMVLEHVQWALAQQMNKQPPNQR
jgi:epoxyqueuosine reductase